MPPASPECPRALERAGSVCAGLGVTYIGQGKGKGGKLRKDLGARKQVGPDTRRSSGSSRAGWDLSAT